MAQSIKFSIGDILVYKSNGGQAIITLIGYEYKIHLKCFAYDLQHHYTHSDGLSKTFNSQKEYLTLKIMVERDGYVHYQVLQ